MSKVTVEDLCNGKVDDVSEEELIAIAVDAANTFMELAKGPEENKDKITNMTHNFMDGGTNSFAHFFHYLDQSCVYSLDDTPGVSNFIMSNHVEIKKVLDLINQH